VGKGYVIPSAAGEADGALGSTRGIEYVMPRDVGPAKVKVRPIGHQGAGVHLGAGGKGLAMGGVPLGGVVCWRSSSRRHTIDIHCYFTLPAHTMMQDTRS
jgi:hypothetical protein